jgi:uridine kinase
VILVSGSLLWWFPEVRDICDMKIFVDTDSDTRLSRRGMERSLAWFCDDLVSNFIMHGCDGSDA